MYLRMKQQEKALPLREVLFSLPLVERQCLVIHEMTNKKETQALRLYKGGTDGNRTSDTRIFSPLLYQLSYGTSVFRAAKLRLFSDTARKNL